MFFKIIFKIGQLLRNPSLRKWYFFLKASENWTSEALKTYQLKKLQELVAIGYTNSPYYTKAFDSLGLKPSDIKSLEDLKILPILTKKELLLYTAEIQTSGSSKKMFHANTSGTTGETLKFKREETADSFNRAAIFRGYSWYNVQPWERNGYFWGFNFSIQDKIKTRLLDSFQNRFRVFGYHKEAITNFTKKLKNASYVHGYSSMLYEAAKLINAQNVQQPLQLKMVKGTSEKIFESYQEAIKKAFGVKMINEYGAAETGIIAFECPSGNMHINMEGVLVEEIENEIIVTNLQMHSFPIIRYKLGDYIKLAPETKQCNCGMQHRILEEVTGRIGETVYGFNNNYPSLYFYYIFKNLALKNSLYITYQVLQHKKGELQFLIEQTMDTTTLKFVEKEIIRYFKNDMTCTILHTQKFTSNNKKLKSFISTVTI